MLPSANDVLKQFEEDLAKQIARDSGFRRPRKNWNHDTVTRARLETIEFLMANAITCIDMLDGGPGTPGKSIEAAHNTLAQAYYTAQYVEDSHDRHDPSLRYAHRFALEDMKMMCGIIQPLQAQVIHPAREDVSAARPSHRRINTAPPSEGSPTRF